MNSGERALPSYETVSLLLWMVPTRGNLDDLPQLPPRSGSWDTGMASFFIFSVSYTAAVLVGVTRGSHRSLCRYVRRMACQELMRRRHTPMKAFDPPGVINRDDHP